MVQKQKPAKRNLNISGSFVCACVHVCVRVCVSVCVFVSTRNSLRGLKSNCLVEGGGCRGDLYL